MREIYIDKFEPLDLASPEGLEVLRECAELAASLRQPPPGVEFNTTIRVDADGMFHCEDSPQMRGRKVIVAAPTEGEARHALGFARRFAELHLKDDAPQNNRICCVSAGRLAGEKAFRAVIWIGREGMPAEWRLQSDDFALDSEGRPIYIVNRGTLEACAGLGMDSPQAMARMEHIARQGLGHVKESQKD